MRVLIADMDEPFCEIQQSYLWNHGHEAEIATDRLECIAILYDFFPDVLLLDQGLLWGGSKGILALMYDDPRLRQIPVILVADSREEFDAAANSSVVAWLRKPFRLSDLLRRLNEASSWARPSGHHASVTRTSSGDGTATRLTKISDP
jgi:CheY-like chemotaxis protein